MSTATQSSSALRTHDCVWRFIQDLAFCYDLADEPITVVFSDGIFNLLGSSDNQVERERLFKRRANAHRLIDGVPRLHDDQKIHITFRVRRPVRVRAKQNDLFGVKSAANAARKPLDGRERYIRRRKTIRLNVAPNGF